MPDERDRPRILITGARGQVGWELHRELAPLGEVIALGRDQLDLVRADATRECVRTLHPALIVNAAAYTAVDQAESEAELAHAVNATAPGVLAEEAARLGAVLVHFSTDYVFDGQKGAPYVESDAPNPLGVYGRTKLEGELAVAAAEWPHLVLRTSWVYGRRGRTFMSRMLRRTDLPEELRVVRDQFSVPTWVRALAAATAAIVARLTGDPRGLAAAASDVAGSYHLASAGGASPCDFAEAVLALDAARGALPHPRLVPVSASVHPTAARRPVDSRMDSSRAARLLGVRIPDWREQLALAMAEG